MSFTSRFNASLVSAMLQHAPSGCIHTLRLVNLRPQRPQGRIQLGHEGEPVGCLRFPQLSFQLDFEPRFFIAQLKHSRPLKSDPMVSRFEDAITAIRLQSRSVGLRRPFFSPKMFGNVPANKAGSFKIPRVASRHRCVKTGFIYKNYHPKSHESHSPHPKIS